MKILLLHVIAHFYILHTNQVRVGKQVFFGLGGWGKKTESVLDHGLQPGAKTLYPYVSQRHTDRPTALQPVLLSLTLRKTITLKSKRRSTC